MSRVWFSEALETTAPFWRVLRRDGITLGFTAHDQDLWFDGVLHKASPGMLPSSIRKSAGFEADSAEVEGALSHDSISADDLAAGRFDGARVLIGLVDWESLAYDVIYTGTIGSITQEAGKFSAALQSRKVELAIDPVPRTSPTCRVLFCGPGCTLSADQFTHEAVLTGIDLGQNRVTVSSNAILTNLLGGTLRWLDGPHAGQTMAIMAADNAGLILDIPLHVGLTNGLRALVREGCDYRLDTCSSRFANAINFQGEPFLPGNDQLYRTAPQPAV